MQTSDDEEEEELLTLIEAKERELQELKDKLAEKQAKKREAEAQYSIKIKCTFSGQTRVFSMNTTASFAEFTTLISKECSGPHTTQYVDGEGDLISISTAADFMEMVDYYKKSLSVKGKPLRVFLKLIANMDDMNIDSVPIPAGPDRPEPMPWRKGKLLGKGGFGCVWLGMTMDGQLVAVKQLDLEDSSNALIDSFDRESNFLQKLKHPHIVQYYGGVRLSKSVALLFLEYIPGGSVASLLQTFGPLDEDCVSSYTRQILMGLEYLHSNGVIHRDLKPGNFLVDTTGVVKLSDFGCSKWAGSKETAQPMTIVGTPNYMAPEVLRSKKGYYGSSADVWSLGMSIIEMVTAQLPFADYTNPAALMFAISRLKSCPTLPKFISEDARSFLSLCLIVTAEQRPSASHLLTHRFLSKVSSSSSDIITPNTPATPLGDDDSLDAQLSNRSATPLSHASNPQLSDDDSSDSYLESAEVSPVALDDSAPQSREFRWDMTDDKDNDQEHVQPSPAKFTSDVFAKLQNIPIIGEYEEVTSSNSPERTAIFTQQISSPISLGPTPTEPAVRTMTRPHSVPNLQELAGASDEESPIVSKSIDFESYRPPKSGLRGKVDLRKTKVTVPSRITAATFSSSMRKSPAPSPAAQKIPRSRAHSDSSRPHTKDNIELPHPTSGGFKSHRPTSATSTHAAAANSTTNNNGTCTNSHNHNHSNTSSPRPHSSQSSYERQQQQQQPQQPHDGQHGGQQLPIPPPKPTIETKAAGPKVRVSAMNTKYDWRYNHHGIWKSFDVSTQRKLEEALKRHQSTITITITTDSRFGCNYLIDLDQMQQTNLASSFTRPIRRETLRNWQMLESQMKQRLSQMKHERPKEIVAPAKFAEIKTYLQQKVKVDTSDLPLPCTGEVRLRVAKSERRGIEAHLASLSADLLSGALRHKGKKVGPQSLTDECVSTINALLGSKAGFEQTKRSPALFAKRLSQVHSDWNLLPSEGVTLLKGFKLKWGPIISQQPPTCAADHLAKWLDNLGECCDAAEALAKANEARKKGAAAMMDPKEVASVAIDLPYVNTLHLVPAGKCRDHPDWQIIHYLHIGNEVSPGPQNLSYIDWCVYVRDATGGSLSQWLEQVEFTLHPSFKIWKVTCTHEPFEVRRKGWGKFEVSIQLSVRGRKLPIIKHMLCFDQTVTWSEDSASGLDNTASFTKYALVSTSSTSTPPATE